MSTTMPPSNVIPFRARTRRTPHGPTRRAPAPRRSRRRTDPATAHTVSLVVLADDDARWLLARVPRCVDEAVVVRDTPGDAAPPPDRTPALPVRTVHPGAPGRGAALSAGLAAATGDYIVTIDADGSMWPGEISLLLHFLDDGYDLVRGSRHLSGGGAPGAARTRVLVDRILVTVVNRLYRTALTDLGYGFCAFRRTLLDGLHVCAPSGGGNDAEMIAHAVRSGLRIAEAPSLQLPRGHGRPHLHAGSDGRRVLKVLLAERSGVRSPVPAATGETR